VGMNRISPPDDSAQATVPHARGDEPDNDGRLAVQ